MDQDPTYLRNRFKKIEVPEIYPDNNRTRKYGHRKPFNSFHFLAILGLILVLFVLVIRIDRHLPPGLKISEEGLHPNRFIAERAYNFLDKLTQLGPRLVGSYANEVAAVDLLKDEIDAIIKNAHPNHVIELDVQKASGDFNIDFLDGMTNVYRDVQNVIVRIGSKSKASPHSLLLNAHFDTAIDSPGASDDGAGCAVLLETLRVLSKSPQILRHDLIFLFNGAEESYLQASHAFITQHRWARNVAAFINLEACGADGKEQLFQAGPYGRWLLDVYAEAVPYPYGSTGGQELFESKVLPADTDFRIFRDFGNVSGLDFAWVSNGYVYHTKFDTIEQISLGSLQRSGDNVLALASAIARGRQLERAEKHEDGRMVYFDILGVFFIRWSSSMAMFINLLAVMVSLYTAYSNIESAKKTDDTSGTQHYRKLIGCISAILGSWILAVITVILIAFCLTSLGKAMSWYSRPVWIIFLYIIPTLLICMTGVLLHAKRYMQDLVLFPSLQFQFYYDACQLIWTALLLIGTVLQIRSLFGILLWVIATSSGNFLQAVSFGKRKDSKWLCFYVATISLPTTLWLYWTAIVLKILIPIAGRMGAAVSSDVVVAVIVGILFVLLFSFIVPLIPLMNNMKRLFSVVIALFILSVFVLLVTSLGFPYSGDTTSLAPQRFMICHTKRTFHNISGSIAEEQGGYWIIDLDVNSPHSVEKYVPEVALAKPTEEDCKNHLYCGVPYPVPALSHYWKNHWLPGPRPQLPPTTMNVVRKENSEDGVRRLEIEIDGAPQMAIVVSPLEGVELNSWSLDSKEPVAGPKWKGRNTYFIHYGRGSASAPLKILMDFKVSSSHSGPIMDLVVCSQYLFEPGKSSTELRDFVAKFPPWAAVNYWTGTYESWTI